MNARGWQRDTAAGVPVNGNWCHTCLEFVNHDHVALTGHGVTYNVPMVEHGQGVIEQQAVKYRQIRDWAWDAVVNGHVGASAIAASLIREFKITGPNGEDPENA